jgi:hypothetical protein
MEKSTLRRVLNRILEMLARFAPGATTLRPFLHSLRGVRITGRVFIGDDVYLENEYPECIEVREGAQICLRSILIAHTRGSGRIVIGKDAFLGANCVVTASPGTTPTIGDGAVVATSSVVAAASKEAERPSFYPTARCSSSDSRGLRGRALLLPG